MLARESPHGGRHPTLVLGVPAATGMATVGASGGGAIGAGVGIAAATGAGAAATGAGAGAAWQRLLLELPRARRALSRVARVDDRDVRVVGDRLALAHEDLGERARERGRHLGVHLVGDDLDDRLTELDLVADLLEPLADGPLGDALAELGHGHRGHVTVRSSDSLPSRSRARPADDTRSLFATGSRHADQSGVRADRQGTGMEDAQIGAAFRAVQDQARPDPADAGRARRGDARSTVSRLERGQIMSLRRSTIRQLAAALEV